MPQNDYRQALEQLQVVQEKFVQPLSVLATILPAAARLLDELDRAEPRKEALTLELAALQQRKEEMTAQLEAHRATVLAAHQALEQQLQEDRLRIRECVDGLEQERQHALDELQTVTQAITQAQRELEQVQQTSRTTHAQMEALAATLTGRR